MRRVLTMVFVATAMVAAATGAQVSHAPRASAATSLWLPWTAGVQWHVSQGNNGTTSHFCPGQLCYAYDLDFSSGQVIRAAADGKIVDIQRGVNAQGSNLGFGNYVVLQHADGTCTRYAHMAYGSVTSKGINAIVYQAEPLGKVGNTGNTLPIGSGQHLHFQRESCSTHNSMATGFVETGGAILTQGNWYTSHNDGCTTSPCAIKSYGNGKFVAAEVSYTGSSQGMLRARSTAIGSWEQFFFVGDCRSSSGCAIKSVGTNKYVSAELGYSGAWNGMLRARATAIGSWEKFQFSGDCRNSSTACTIKSLANSKYVSAELGYSAPNTGMLRARATAIGNWEKFILY